MDLDLEETWSKSKKDPPSAFEECHQAECDLIVGVKVLVFGLCWVGTVRGDLCYWCEGPEKPRHFEIGHHFEIWKGR